MGYGSNNLVPSSPEDLCKEEMFTQAHKNHPWRYAPTWVIYREFFFTAVCLPLLWLFTLWYQGHWAIQALLCFLLGSQITHSLTVVHEILHGSFSNKEGMNSIMVFVQDCCWYSSTLWKVSHNKGHHIKLGTLQDPDFRLFHLKYWSSFFLNVFLPGTMVAQFIRENWRFSPSPNYTICQTLKQFFIHSFIPWYFFNRSPLFFLSYMLVSGAWYRALVMPAHYTMKNFPHLNKVKPEFDCVVKNTNNYQTDSVFVTWFVGGNNYQIEHHINPRICSYHMREFHLLVKKAAKVRQLTFNSYDTWIEGVIDQVRATIYFYEDTQRIMRDKSKESIERFDTNFFGLRV